MRNTLIVGVSLLLAFNLQAEELNHLDVSVYISCENSTIRSAQLANLHGPLGSRLNSTDMNILNQNEVHSGRHNEDGIVGYLTTDISLENEILFEKNKDDLDSCKNGEDVFFRIDKKVEMTPAADIVFTGYGRNIKCDYEPDGIDYTGTKNTFEEVVEISRGEERIRQTADKVKINSNDKCISGESFIGGVTRTLAIPLAILFGLFGSH